MTQSTITLEGNVWAGDNVDPVDGVLLDCERCKVAVERTDADEVAIHATLPGDCNAVVSVYIDRVAALALSKLLERGACER